MSEPLEVKRTTVGVKCEKHGLHYDPSKSNGCVICRREAGGGSTAVRSAPKGSLGQALAVTAVLLLLTTACLYFVHGLVIKSFRGGGEANALDTAFEDPMREAEFPEEDEGGPVYSGSEGN